MEIHEVESRDVVDGKVARREDNGEGGTILIFSFFFISSTKGQDDWRFLL